MNFLSHYYFETSASPEFSLGLILPDLYPSFNQHLRRKIRLNPVKLDSSKEILAGINTHFLQDKVFHSSAFFKDKEIYLKKNMPLAFLEKPRSRPFFFHHIYFEMLMDRLLLEEETNLGIQFFQKLANIQPKLVVDFFEEINCAEAVADFFAIFNRFLDSKFLLDYNDNEFFINALTRTYKRVVSYIPIENSDLKMLNTYLEKDSSIFKPEIMRFFDSFEYK